MASQQAGTWEACPSNGQAGSQAAARERLARQAHGFGRRPATELSWTTVSQNLPDPGKKKIGWQPRPRKKKYMAGLPVRHSSQLAGRPAWQPGSSLPGGWQSHLDRRSVHAPCQAPAIGQAGQPPEPPGIARQPANIGSHFQRCV